jgi:hypothetical protein
LAQINQSHIIMLLKRILILGLLISTGVLNAQKDFRAGYIIKNSGDTLYGEIDYRGDLLMSNKCKFKQDNNITEFIPTDILGFRFTDSKYYISKEVDGKMVFLEYLVKGKVDIYYMRDKIGDHYYLDKEDSALTELPYNEEIRYRDGKKYIYKSTKHIGLLNVYLQDAPGLQSEINNIKKPEHQNMVKLAEDYHNVVCNGEKCIIYEKKQPLIKVNYEILAGVYKATNTEFFDFGKFPLQTGILLHFWLPRLNEKFYIKTGILYSFISETEDLNFFPTCVPFHLGYLAPKTYKIRPTASISLLSPSYSAGLLVKINEKVNLGVQSWLNFEPFVDRMPWIPEKMNYYTILGSLYIEL